MSGEPTNPKLDLDAKLEAEINEALEEIDFESALEDAAPPIESGAAHEEGEDDSAGDASSGDEHGAAAQSDSSDAAAPNAASTHAATGAKKRRATGSSSRPRRGVRLRTHAGTVVALRGDDVMVELGPRSQGICPLSQFPTPPEIGSQHDFLIDRVDPKDNVLVLSLPGAVRKAEWGTLDVGQVVEARCVGVIRGGLEMEVAGHKAFMPASHADVRHVKDVSIFLNEKFPCEVVQLDRKRGRMVLSRRKVLARERKQKVRELLDKLQPGDTVEATIVSLQPYGAFADIGGLDGLIHVSDLSHDRIKHPQDVVKVGDTVQAKVLKIDGSQKPPKISLGLKQLSADPYAARIEEIKEGEVVTGRVTKLLDFGAFVELAPGVEGLVHVSEIAWERIKTPAQVLKQDQVVSVKILNVNKDERRISLSIKATQDRPQQPQHAAQGGPSAGGRGRGGRGSNMFRGYDDQTPGGTQREADAHMAKLRAALSKKFSDNLKGGIG